jgi:surface protein
MIKKTTEQILIFSTLIVLLSFLTKCKSKEEQVQPEDQGPEVIVTIDDYELEVQENPALGDTLITIEATSSNNSPIKFYIIEQSIDEATIIDKETGELLVYEPAAFDFENNSEISVMVEALGEGSADTSIIHIKILDVKEFDGAFVTTWKTFYPNQEITIPTNSSTFDYNYSVDWGDGSLISEEIKGDASHIYKNPGIYTIKIVEQFPAIYMNGRGNRGEIQTIEQWGENVWLSMESAFEGCSNLVCIAEDVPNLSQVTSMRKMFKETENFQGDLSKWDVSKVIDMSWLFASSRSFNSDISNWNVSQVEDMNHMFFYAESFNMPISNWNVSRVKDMESMFGSSYSFNQSLNSWDISSVTNLREMFGGSSSFNQDLNEWDVSSVTDMAGMFASTDAFNGNIESWDVKSVTVMTNMFREAIAFSGNISQWDVSSVESMSFMFTRAGEFDTNLGNWDIRSVSSMSKMLTSSGLSIANYDATLDGWSKHEELPTNIELGAEGLKYCEQGAVARNILINNYNWFIERDTEATDDECL